MLFLLAIGVSVYASAQTTINGVVSSGVDGESLPGVSVVVKGTATGTATDIDGNFSLTIPSDRAVLVFTYIGYKAKEIPVTGSSKNLKVVLDEDNQLLDEVVVVGYGTMKRSDLTGAVSSIGAKQIKESVSTSLEQAMQGRIAGVQITQNSGAPGGGISVSIRGINSLNGNEPMYVIDGVELTGSASGNSSVLSTINPADILSIDVLKDASAMAIYGSRAANGVVMITTKRGEDGKPRLSYDGYFGLQQLPKKLPVMNLKEFASFYNERARIQGWGERPDFLDTNLLTDGTDWQDELFRTALMHNHQVGVMGGSNGTKYALSAGYLNQEGIALGSSFDRFSFRSNMDMDITKWLQVGVNASLANTKQVTTLDNAGIIRTAINQRPDIPAYNPDGSFGEVPIDDFNTYYTNPLAEARLRENYNTGTQVYYNTYANLKLAKGLQLRTEYGGNLGYSNSYQFTPNYSYGNQVMSSSSTRNSNKNNYWSWKTYATYDFKLSDMDNMQIMAGHEANESTWEYLQGSRTGYISNSVHSLDVGNSATAKNGNNVGDWAMESYFGRLNYNFDDRYLLTATMREDGSSYFDRGYKWGVFPSAAFAWRISNESFLKNNEMISNMKLRLGWGIVGNQSIEQYAYGVPMNTTETYWGTGYYAGRYPMPNLRWERTNAVNIGLDLALIKNRIELIIDAYSKNTDNLLMIAREPMYIVDEGNNLGISAPYDNIGALTNKGIDFALNTVNIQNSQFTWRSNLTMTFNKNKVTKLYSDGAQVFGKIGNTIYTQSTVGEPVGQLFGYNVIGMFTCEDDFYKKDAAGNFLLDEGGHRIEVARPEQSGSGQPYPIAPSQIWVGDYIYEDLPTEPVYDDQGKIIDYQPDGIINEKDRKPLGNTQPKFTYGFNNTITWKNFELNIFINGVYGNKIYNLLRESNTGTGGYGNVLREVGDYARVELIDPAGENVISNVYVPNATTAKVQRLTSVAGSTNDNNRISSRFVEDGSYLRLKNVSLTYAVPRQLLQKAGIDYMQIYANVQNIFTITKYKGYDPEVGSYNVLTNGLDDARYPSQRIYTFGLRFNF